MTGFLLRPVFIMKSFIVNQILNYEPFLGWQLNLEMVVILSLLFLWEWYQEWLLRKSLSVNQATSSFIPFWPPWTRWKHFPLCSKALYVHVFVSLNLLGYIVIRCVYFCIPTGLSASTQCLAHGFKLDRDSVNVSGRTNGKKRGRTVIFWAKWMMKIFSLNFTRPKSLKALKCVKVEA